MQSEQHEQQTNQTAQSQPTETQQTAVRLKDRCRKDRRTGIIVGIAVLVAAAATLAFTFGNKASAESVEDCTLQLTALSAHQEALKTTQESADEAAKLTEKDVEDASLLKDLTAAQTAVNKLGDAPTCPTDGSQQDVDDATAAIRDYADELRSATSGLDAAAKAAIASHESLTGSAE